jgi:hypothetical protein
MGAYFSGVIILLANCQYYPTDKMARQDHEQATDGMKVLAQLVFLKHDKQFDRMASVLNNLESIAIQAIDHYQGHPDIPPAPPPLAEEDYSISEHFFDGDIINELVSETIRTLGIPEVLIGGSLT